MKVLAKVGFLTDFPQWQQFIVKLHCVIGVCLSEPLIYYGLTVVSLYVGMSWKQDGGSNQCISVYTVIFIIGEQILASLKAAYICCPCLQ